MAFGKKNRIKEGLESYSLCLLGESGIGKTTLIYNVCQKLFGDDGYMIFNVGKEQGIDAIDDVTYEDIENWKKLDTVVKDIVKNKDIEYPNLKVIVIDTLDQMIDITEPEVIRRWNAENVGEKNFKLAKTINGSWGGFGRGEDMVISTILDKVWELEKVGVKVWYTGHVKTREILDPITNTTYSTLSTNMQTKTFNGFKTKMHVVGIACLDRTIESEGTGRKNIVTKQEITVNKVKEEKRKIVFRDDNYSVDSKSRFANIVNEVPMDTEEFIKALQDAIKSSKVEKTTSPKPAKNKETKKDETLIEEDLDDKPPFDTDDTEEDMMDTNTDYPEDLVDVIRTMFKDCADKELKAEVKELIAEHGKLNDVPTEALKVIYDKLK